MSEPPPTRRKKRNVTIRDVAQRVGVSPMTVSRVINDNGRFSEATRTAVNTAIEQLGFSRNAAAHNLARAHSIHIGILYDRPSGGYLGELLIGLMDQAGRNGHRVTLQRCDGTADVDGAIERLVRSGVDGVILLPPFGDMAGVRDRFAAAGRKIVIISGGPHGSASGVRIDDHAAARQLTETLIAKGHRTVGFIAGDPSQAASADRRRGFRDACAAAGITPGPIAAGDFSYRSGIAAATDLIARASRPTAIFASNDDMAAAAVTVAHRHGLDLPRDLAVVGFDDTRIAVTTWPELTTIRQPLAEMARVATELLARAVEHPDRPGENVILPHVLVERSSA